jgi:hypothetical protein
LVPRTIYFKNWGLSWISILYNDDSIILEIKFGILKYLSYIYYNKIIKVMATQKNSLGIPDPKKHQLISFIKSGIRIFGYFLLPFNLLFGAGVLILSEIVGIYEELV